MMLTVVSALGSTPRSAGARMLVVPDDNGHQQVGTIGGGKTELRAVQDALQLFQEKKGDLRDYDLSLKSGQACGGKATVLHEYIGPSFRLVIFGAGHVAGELFITLRDAPFAVTVVDDRPEWNSEERFPHASRISDWQSGIKYAVSEPELTFACVMTYSHKLDYEVCRGLMENPPSYVGLMGSAGKKKLLFGKLREDGISEDRIAAIHCPIGIGDLGKTPSLVAVSVAAQLLQEAAGRES